MEILTLLIVMLVLKSIVFLILQYNDRKWKKNDGQHELSLSVDIVVPMYNEEEIIVKTIQNILKIDYQYYNIIVVDDGSTDRSLSLVKAHFKNHGKIKILSQANQGKSAALNRAIASSHSEIVICIDSDTHVKSNIIQKILPFFEDSRVAAVSGYVMVGNRTNAITNMQYVEYITSQNCERIAFESVNGILVVPGAIGAFRRSIVVEVGGYVSDTLTEDTDITLRLISRNYIIRNATEAIGYTEAPSTISMFFNQRVRWKVGTIQCLLKYSQSLSTSSNKVLPRLVIPYAWIYCIFLPVILPIVDYIFVYNVLLMGVNVVPVTSAYFIFILIDYLAAMYVFVRCDGNASLIKYLIFQRFMIRHLSFMVYIHIVIRYVCGGLFNWNKLRRYGDVSMQE